jgi:xylulokinase
MASDVVLGLDLGTSGLKAALFDAADGSVIASATRGYPLLHPQPGWAEQNPEDWWEATIAAIQACLAAGAAAGIVPEQVRGMGISGQMHGAVLLDGAGNPLRPCIIWADQRSQAQCDWITQQVGQERLIDLVSNPALTGFTAPKVLWVRDNEPEIWSRVRRILLPKDYLRWRLTGVEAMEISDAAGTCLLDVTHGIWSAELLRDIGLDPALLPPVVGATEIAGTLTPEVAQLTGLLAGLPIAGGGADNACGAVGAGIVSPGLALLSIGTSGVLLAYSATPLVDRSGPIPRAHTFNHAVPQAWYLMGVTQGAGLSLRWVRDHIGAAEVAAAQASGRDAYDVLSEEAAAVPAGSEGLLFLPYLQGERTPVLDAQARGGWIGLTARHERRHLVRSVLEGVAFSLRDCLEVVRASGVEVRELRATGGGVRSAVWRQILADVLGVPLLPVGAEEGPAFGAALLGGVAAGVYPSVAEACAQTVRTGDPVNPDQTNSIRDDTLYSYYRGLYPALAATMQGLAAFEQG